MTREEAKEILTHNWTRVDNPNYSDSELDEAFFMAIEALSADAMPTVIRAKTFMRKEDFDKWAENIKKQGENIICIPCDAEVVSADSVVRCKDCVHHGMRDCPVWEDVITEDYMWCYKGERREP